MRINFFKEKNKIRLNKNLDFDSDIAISNANNESNNYLTANSDIWPYLLDSMVLCLKYPTIYEKCLNSELESKVLSQIDLDIIRTFPHNKNV
ncbi:hypothetical protein PFUGPA_04263 [Plasmodium falciparum Palo Alto/Uganda]|uniref:Uncharacterized protein n=1 Tax=Plasmodium falciparum (isolate Palo Alto / Uganda) TaxID=57270 RepID=W4IYE8_PLAFP|nr:hypothetical protein PFUGPA_04263 [Plasmodium falciparum Palo Alto/Uganda]